MNSREQGFPHLLNNYIEILGFPQMIEKLAAMQETWVRFLGWEDPLEQGMETDSSILAWEIPMDRGAWCVTAHGVTKSQMQLKQLNMQ